MLQKMLRNGYSNKAIMDVMEHYCLPPPINKLCIFIINVQQSYPSGTCLYYISVKHNKVCTKHRKK